MQPYTGKLRDIADGEEMLQAIAENFEPLPEHLNRAARRKLNGKKTAMVSLTSGGELSKYAACLRKKKRQEARKARKASRH